jgi:hypothetical protein
LARRFFRLIQKANPDLEDFRSHYERGVTFRFPLDPEASRLSHGVSVSDDPPKLRKQALNRPTLGRYIATLLVEDSGAVRWEKTTNRRDHHTLWGTADAILACVERVDPIAPLSEVD